MFAPTSTTLDDDHLAAGRYAEAIQAAPPPPPPIDDSAARGLTADDLLADTAAHAAAMERLGIGDAPSRVTVTRTAPPLGAAATVLVVSPALRRFAALRTRGLWALAGTRLARGLGAAAIVTVSAYMFYGDTFIGTDKEIWGLIAIAFSTEFTIEHTLEVLTQARG